MQKDEGRRAFKVYKPLKSPVGDYKELRIEVNYSMGGYNYFSGTQNKRGYRLSLTPVNVTITKEGNKIESCTLLGSRDESGYYIFLAEAARFNAKELAKWAAVVEPHVDRIAELYSQRQHKAIDGIFHPAEKLPEVALLKVDGQVEKIAPQNGDKFTLEELQKFVGGLIEPIEFPDGRMIIVNEEGKLNGLKLNAKATELWREQFPVDKYPVGGDDVIVGDAVVCPSALLN